MKHLDARIDAWANAVGIHGGSTAMKQALYTLSETQELLSAVNMCDESTSVIGDLSLLIIDDQFNDSLREEYRSENQVLHEKIAEVADAIGDIYVTLKNVAHFYSLDMEECVTMAVETIEERARKGGKMEGGVFVKPD